MVDGPLGQLRSGPTNSDGYGVVRPKVCRTRLSVIRLDRAAANAQITRCNCVEAGHFPAFSKESLRFGN